MIAIHVLISNNNILFGDRIMNVVITEIKHYNFHNIANSCRVTDGQR